MSYKECHCHGPHFKELHEKIESAENERIEWVKRGERAESLCTELTIENEALKRVVEAVRQCSIGSSLVQDALAELDRAKEREK